MNPTSQFSGRRVLVTGAGGFLGRHLLPRLAKAGAEVFGLGRGAPPAGFDSRRWLRTDCTDLVAVQHAFQASAPDYVFHLAGHAEGQRDLDLVQATLHGDLVTTVNVLTAATERGCRRIVLAGSLEEPRPSEDDGIPSSPYAAAKGAATAYARMFHRLYGAPVVVGRVFMTYGPGQRERKIVPYLARQLLSGQEVRLTSPGRAVDWIYVDDTVAGLMALALADGVSGEVLDLGAGELVTIRAIAEQMANLVGGTSTISAAVAEPAREPVRVADAERTFRRIGWRAETPLAVGLTRTIAWYRERIALEATPETV